MDENYSEAVKEAFIKLYEKGLIYRGNYIINWCPHCKTALSDEEAAHKEINGWLYYIKYPVMAQNPPFDEVYSEQYRKAQGRQAKTQSSYIVVATTRPETMLGDTAIAINPNDKRYEWLKEAKVILPVVERELRVIQDEVVDPEFGTGIVKVTPSHDPVDFALGKKHNLDFINIMDDNAALNKNVPDDFIGMDRFEAREALLALLEERKLIEKKEPYKVSAGHCYRCHTIIEPRISLQWFVIMKPLAKEAIKVVEEDKVKFYPQRWKKVYLNWMRDIHDWCISRQIWWGHRLPVYYCESCQKQTDKQIVSSQQSTDKPKSTNYEPRTVVTRGIIVSKVKPDKCPYCNGRDIYQDKDVLDTWFSSWLWPFATFGWPFTDHASRVAGHTLKQKELNYFYPTNCLVTASEILFFWVARMIMSGLEFMGEIPFKDVIIHGTVRDARGVKMSKSLGNTIDPLEVIDKFGADALRFSLMLLAASGSDVYLTEEKFLVGRNFSNKVWNATRFIFLKVKENKLTVNNLELEKLDEIDKWVLKELNEAIEQITSRLDNYSLNDATKKIYDFFWHVFCDWYIEIVKDEFTLDKAKISIFVLLNSIKLLHPFMPFITEEIFELIKNHTALSEKKILVNSLWPSTLDFEIKEQELEKLNILFDTIKEIRNIKSDLALKQKKIKLEVKLRKNDSDLWQVNKSWIQRLTFSEDIVFKEELKRTLYENDLWALNLAIESVDMSGFLSSLDKKINNLDAVLDRTRLKLENQKFLQNASSDIIKKEKDKTMEMSLQLRRFKELKNVFG